MLCSCRRVGVTVLDLIGGHHSTSVHTYVVVNQQLTLSPCTPGKPEAPTTPFAPCIHMHGWEQHVMVLLIHTYVHTMATRHSQSVPCFLNSRQNLSSHALPWVQCHPQPPPVLRHQLSPNKAVRIMRHYPRCSWYVLTVSPRAPCTPEFPGDPVNPCNTENHGYVIPSPPLPLRR